MAKKPKRSRRTVGPSKKIHPSSPPNLLQQALALHQGGRLHEAESLYRRVLQKNPEHPKALLCLGVLAQDVGKSDVAVALLSRAIASKPDFAEAYYNLGIVHLVHGKADEAIVAFRQALTLKPNYTAAHNNLGNALLTIGEAEEAVNSYRRAVALQPGYAEAHYNLGNALEASRQLDEAVAAYQRAITLQPDYVEAHYNLGIIYQEQGKPDKATACYRRALALRPEYKEAYNNLGSTLKDQGNLEEAIACFRQALTLEPDYAEAHSNLLFCMNYLPMQGCTGYLDEARRYGRMIAEKVRLRYSDWQCPAEPERLRVGLVSDDFRNHPVGYFLETMLASIDRSKVQLMAYPVRSINDALTARLRSYFSGWESLSGLDDSTAAQLIHADGVHILLDLSGHTSHNRLPVFARRPAPVQASWLGYFASTGLAEMDYLLADPVSVPESGRKQFSEKVWYLPETRMCFSPPLSDQELATTPLPALDNGFITFGCFQNLAKLNNRVLAIWGKIFQAIPQARIRIQTPLYSSPAIREQLQHRFVGSGIAPERVTFENPMSRKAYLEAHSQIDIILDTFPFPGGTTTCEALWMGVPTLTLAGNTMLARQGAGILSAAGLADWIADDENGYVAKAISYAADPARLSLLRAGLRKQVAASPLFDGPRFARNFEAALWGMWQEGGRL